ncbi:MAG: nucleotidyl transferase AbiEii/AbiGii toxin family protein [Verrucomicrobium sp.]|jgi:predicted nucleotidyltransferase component of viral defense system|nr:nucleotidyl transferase AbiEii/AbiGii toxin family protein [Verrucomicrobium sp.]
MKTPNLSASVRQRLLTLAQSRNWEFNRVLARYGIERVLCRLAASSHGERFLLKGATLFTVWEGSPHRATRDLDLLGLRRRSLEELVALFREVIATPVEPDGLVFGEVTAEPIRAAMEAGGIRIVIRAELAGARIPVQVDVGFGDATVPPPVTVEFPTLLNTPKPKLRAYPPETVIAEKLEAMVRLGLANSRMKDFFDIWHLAQAYAFDGELLTGAIHATFAARKTPLPTDPVTALTSKFSEDPGKRIQWNAFVQQAAVAETTPSLPEVVGGIRDFLGPLLASFQSGSRPPRKWQPKQCWL